MDSTSLLSSLLILQIVSSLLALLANLILYRTIALYSVFHDHLRWDWLLVSEFHGRFQGLDQPMHYLHYYFMYSDEFPSMESLPWSGRSDPGWSKTRLYFLRRKMFSGCKMPTITTVPFSSDGSPHILLTHHSRRTLLFNVKLCLLRELLAHETTELLCRLRGTFSATVVIRNQKRLFSGSSSCSVLCLLSSVDLLWNVFYQEPSDYDYWTTTVLSLPYFSYSTSAYCMSTRILSGWVIFNQEMR